MWLTRDPAGFVDGPNLYAYVRQNPWSKFDPYGLASHGWLIDTVWNATVKPASEFIGEKAFDVVNAIAPEATMDLVESGKIEMAIAGAAKVEEVGETAVNMVVPVNAVIAGAEKVVNGDFSGAIEAGRDIALSRFKVARKALTILDHLEMGMKVAENPEAIIEIAQEAAVDRAQTKIGAGLSGKKNAAKRGPKTDPTAPHNAKIRSEADALEADGNEILAGGGRRPERAIETPGGHKGSRRPDILYKTPGGTVKGRNVGKTKADASPVSREQKAMEDLNGAGVETDFVPYDR